MQKKYSTLLMMFFKKYYALNSEDIKQRRIEKMKKELAKLEGVAN